MHLRNLLFLLQSTAWLLLPLQFAAAQESFEASFAEERLLEIEQTYSNLTDISELADLIDEVTGISQQADSCVKQAEVAINENDRLRSLLGETSSEDSADLLERRIEFNNNLDNAKAKKAVCSLVAANSEDVKSQVNQHIAELSAQRLTSNSGDIIENIKNYNVLDHVWTGFSAPFNHNKWFRIALFGFVLVLSWILGRLLSRRLLTWADHQRGKSGGPALTTVLVRNVAPSSKLFLAGISATLTTVFWLGGFDLQNIWLRLSLALLFIGLGRSIATWFQGPYSPGADSIYKQEDASNQVRRRSQLLFIAIASGFVIFGPLFLSTLPEPELFSLRALLLTFIATSLAWFIRVVRHIPAFKNRFHIGRWILVYGCLLAVVIELTGFRLLANYVLLGVLGSIIAVLSLWSLLWLLAQCVRGIIEGQSQFSYRMRSWLGLRQQEASAELGWLKLVGNLALWVVFFLFLVWLWDTTGRAIPQIQTYVTEGFTIAGDKKFIPKSVFIGLGIFGLIIAATAWLKTKLNTRWLREMGMDRGARDALVTMSGYIGFIVAVLAGLTAAGISIAGLALAFAALSVGIGLGLQGIVNNFVSGLTLLLERPIKSGDFVSVGEVEGFVKQIRMRATEIETLDRQNVIVPNSELISNQVTNWVLHDTLGRLCLNIGVAYGSDTRKVKEILEGIAKEHEEVVSGRKKALDPKALFMGFGDSSLDFELRVWIISIEKRFHVTSDLNFAIDQAFRENNIQIPFPQRDLHVRTTPTDYKDSKPPHTDD